MNTLNWTGLTKLKSIPIVFLDVVDYDSADKVKPSIFSYMTKGHIHIGSQKLCSLQDYETIEPNFLASHLVIKI